MIEPTGVSIFGHCFGGAALRVRLFAASAAGFGGSGLEPLDVRLQVDSPGEIAGVDDVVDLALRMAAMRGVERRQENLAAKRVDVGGFRLGVPRQIDDVRGRNLPKLGVVIRDRQRGGTLGIDDQKDIFRPAARRGGRGGQQRPRQAEAEKSEGPREECFFQIHCVLHGFLVSAATIAAILRLYASGRPNVATCAIIRPCGLTSATCDLSAPALDDTARRTADYFALHFAIYVAMSRLDPGSCHWS